ncbi:uncharacterized protein LOC135938758 isoform X1 [Cloeon dipterum]|uniref:uncharacterized protein LOC135938758 isoform X1 n=1 Tax=Cloeon dipterum TaxID=197152 RepID=UPI0032204B21
MPNKSQYKLKGASEFLKFPDLGKPTKSRHSESETDLGLPRYDYHSKMRKVEPQPGPSSVESAPAAAAGAAAPQTQSKPNTFSSKCFQVFKPAPEKRKENLADETDVQILPNPVSASAKCSAFSTYQQRQPLTNRQPPEEEDIKVLSQREVQKRHTLASAGPSGTNWLRPAQSRPPFSYSRKEACTSTPKRSCFTNRKVCVDSKTIRRDTRQVSLRSLLYNNEEKTAYRRLIMQAANMPSMVQFRTPIFLEKKKIPLIDLTLDERNILPDLTSKSKEVKKLEIPAFKKPEVITLDAEFKPKAPVVARNSFGDSLKDKPFMKEGFAEGIYDRYSDKQQLRAKDIEQTKKDVQLLEVHSRSVFEFNSVARALKLATLFDIEKEEEIEEIEEEKLPELPDEAYIIVDKALYPRPPQEVLVSGFNADITRKDISTLADRNWLNDEVINFYMELIRERGNLDNFPKVHTFNTFFYPRLRQTGYSALKRWTKKVDIFAQDLIVIPIHLGVHWCMSILDMKNKHAHYFDSMLTSNPSVLTLLMKYLEEESVDKKKVPYDTSKWKLIQEKEIPVQHNGYDCGVFACMFAEAGSRRGKFLFTQDDMPDLRKRMVYEILTKKLLT